MENAKEKIDTIYKLNAEVQDLLEKESDEYKKVLERKDEKRTIKRPDGEVEVTISELLEEVRVAGADSPAGKELKKDFPKLFEIAEKREEKNNELHDYIQKEFGFSFRRMGVADYLKLTEAVIEAKKNE